MDNRQQYIDLARIDLSIMYQHMKDVHTSMKIVHSIFQKYVDEQRIFHEGDIVSVYNTNHFFISEGIVGTARIPINTTKEDELIKCFLDRNYLFENLVIEYEVYGRMRNGNRTKGAFNSRNPYIVAMDDLWRSKLTSGNFYIIAGEHKEK